MLVDPSQEKRLTHSKIYEGSKTLSKTSVIQIA